MKYVNRINFLRRWLLGSVCLVMVTVVLLAGCASQRGCYVGVQGGGMVYYEERGKGEPLILLHGHSLDRRMWDTQWRDFSARYRTIRSHACSMARRHGQYCAASSNDYYRRKN